jgi:hypothetical protein
MMAVTQDTIKDQKITAWFADNDPGIGRAGAIPGLARDDPWNWTLMTAIL